MLQDLRIEKEDLQALLSEMEKCGFVATTLHEIRTFTITQRRIKRAIDTPLADGTRTDSKNMFVSPESRTDGTAGN